MQYITLGVLKSIVDVLWDGCLLISKEGTIVYSSHNCADLFGYSIPELNGQLFTLLVPQHIRDDHVQYITTFSNRMNYMMGKNRYVHGVCKNGKSVPLEIRLSTVVVDGCERILAIFRNKEQDIEILSELETAKKQLQDALIEKTYFVANLSHEIRAPINGILGISQLMIDATDKERNEYLKTLEDSSTMLLSLLNTILDYTRLEKEDMQMDKTPINTTNFFMQVKRYYDIVSAQQRITFTIDIEDVPETIIMNEIRLRQVLTNLIGNAMKFTSVDGYIHVRVYCQGVSLCLSVADNGIGINEQEQKNLFKPFVQANSSIVHEYGGTGLGLAICKSIIEKMGGVIELQSQQHQGTTVVCMIPLIYESGIQRISMTLSSNGQEPSIIIVDDHLVNQYVLKKYLEKLGYTRVFTFSNGKEILRQIQNGKRMQPAIIFMDLHMPLLDGYSCATELRALGVQAPIIAIAEDFLEADALYKKEGVVHDCLTKPFEIQQVQSILRRYI